MSPVEVCTGRAFETFVHLFTSLNNFFFFFFQSMRFLAPVSPKIRLLFHVPRPSLPTHHTNPRLHPTPSSLVSTPLSPISPSLLRFLRSEQDSRLLRPPMSFPSWMVPNVNISGGIRRPKTEPLPLSQGRHFTHPGQFSDTFPSLIGT